MDKLLERAVGKAIDNVLKKGLSKASLKNKVEESVERRQQKEPSYSEEQVRQRFLTGLGGPPTLSNDDGSELLTETQIRQRYLVSGEVSWDGNKLLEAQWTTAFINDLPDDCFAFIKPGGKKDEDGKTVPRSLRYLPYKNAKGEIDKPHLRNALARLDQTDLSDEEKKKAKDKLDAAAKEAKIGEYREESTLDGKPPLKLPRGWKKKLGWAFGEQQESHEKNLTEEQVHQRKLVGLIESEKTHADDGSFRDDFADLRRKFFESLKGIKRPGDSWSILGVGETTIIAAVYDEDAAKTNYFALGYVVEGDKIRITRQEHIPTGDGFDLNDWLIKIRAEFKGSNI
jgi:hypothetical protein